jgi:hypothetical protein
VLALTAGNVNDITVFAQRTHRLLGRSAEHHSETHSLA